MLHRCHNLKRTSPSRLSMKQADPALQSKEPFALFVKPRHFPHPNFWLKFEKPPCLDECFCKSLGETFNICLYFSIFFCSTIQSLILPGFRLKRLLPIIEVKPISIL